MSGELQDWLSNLESWSTIIRNFGLVIAAVIALWFAKKRIAVSDRQAETAQRGLLNERYQKGAEMLGSKVLSVRLGGIYALHRLAEDEPEQYHVQIMRQFCAFVSYPTEDKDYIAGLEATKHQPHRGPIRRSKRASRVREDVQAAIRAIGTRNASDIQLEKSEKFFLKLTGADLSKANLADVNLTGAMLLNTNLRLAYLIGTDLTGVHLSGATETFGLTQGQLDLAQAAPDYPPDLGGLGDVDTGKHLEWRGR